MSDKKRDIILENIKEQFEELGKELPEGKTILQLIEILSKEKKCWKNINI